MDTKRIYIISTLTLIYMIQTSYSQQQFPLNKDMNLQYHYFQKDSIVDDGISRRYKRGVSARDQTFSELSKTEIDDVVDAHNAIRRLQPASNMEYMVRRLNIALHHYVFGSHTRQYIRIVIFIVLYRGIR